VNRLHRQHETLRGPPDIPRAGRGAGQTRIRCQPRPGRRRLPSSRCIRPPLLDGDTRSRHRAGQLRRTELAAFLRSRRERITPEEAGLPRGGRRRTPGLRREEVAQLAGVGVTWYTWLEQGSDIHASEQVLDAVARTLMLDPHEKSHLFTLAGAQEPTIEQECQALSPAVQVLLDRLEPYPACVQNARFDVLAFNRCYGQMIGDIEGMCSQFKYLGSYTEVV
jgi:transcriptional regulator with XRE-family HTH domain